MQNTISVIFPGRDRELFQGIHLSCLTWRLTSLLTATHPHIRSPSFSATTKSSSFATATEGRRGTGKEGSACRPGGFGVAAVSSNTRHHQTSSSVNDLSEQGSANCLESMEKVKGWRQSRTDMFLVKFDFKKSTLFQCSFLPYFPIHWSFISISVCTYFNCNYCFISVLITALFQYSLLSYFNVHYCLISTFFLACAFRRTNKPVVCVVLLGRWLVCFPVTSLLHLVNTQLRSLPTDRIQGNY